MHQRAGEMKAQRPLHMNSNGIEAQPNSMAPLLRDEKARREWIEHELDMCCQVQENSQLQTTESNAITYLRLPKHVLAKIETLAYMTNSCRESLQGEPCGSN